MATQKKTAEVDYSMQEKILALYELQKIDSKIDEINKVKGELPLEVQDLEDEVAGMKTRIDHINAEIEELNNLTKQRKREVDQARIMIGNYKEQQNNVRNNREFDALNKEIEFQKLEIELQDKKIREAQKNIAEKEALVAESKQRYEDKMADLDAKKGELDDIINETHKDEEALQAKSDALSKTIDDRLLTAYRRIRSNARNGLAVVTVDRDACGGCFNKIPPQRQLDIRSRKKIIVCEYCGRILIDKYICDYDGSQQKADLEAAMEAQKKKSRRLRREE